MRFVIQRYLDNYTAKFSNVNVTFMPVADNSRLYGYTLSLDGDIGVNFYMELSEEMLGSDDAYMLLVSKIIDNCTPMLTSS